jgi:hypothetical protein
MPAGFAPHNSREENIHSFSNFDWMTLCWSVALPNSFDLALVDSSDIKECPIRQLGSTRSLPGRSHQYLALFTSPLSVGKYSFSFEHLWFLGAWISRKHDVSFHVTCNYNHDSTNLADNGSTNQCGRQFPFVQRGFFLYLTSFRCIFWNVKVVSIS